MVCRRASSPTSRDERTSGKTMICNGAAESAACASARRAEKPERRARGDMTDRLQAARTRVWAARDAVRDLRRCAPGAPTPTQRLAGLAEEAPRTREELRDLVLAVAGAQGALEAEIKMRTA